MIRRFFYSFILLTLGTVILVTCSKSSPVDEIVTGIDFETKTITITKGETQSIIAKISPPESIPNITKSSLNISSTDPLVAFVHIDALNSGNIVVQVTAVNIGETTITLSDENIDTTASIKVFVNAKEYPNIDIDTPEFNNADFVKKIEFDRYSISLQLDQIDTIHATLSPNHISDTVIQWESSNPTKITVTNNGIITAKDIGISIITAKAGERMATCEVNVYRTYTVKFDSKGGSNVSSQTIKEGLKATKPSVNPTRAGYLFGGWKKDGEDFDFENTDIIGDITLQAKWFLNGSLNDWEIEANANDDTCIVGYTGSATDIVFPPYVDGKRIIGIKGKNNKGIFGQDMGSENTNIVSLDFTQSVYLKSIIDSAFMYCTALTSIDLTPTIDTLGEQVFLNCNSLKDIVLSDSINYIGESAFRLCSALETIFFNIELTYIADRAFENDTSLIYVYLPPKVDSMGSKVFLGDNHITKLVLSKTLITIGELAFSGCNALDTVVIKRASQPLTSIQANTFDGTPINRGDNNARILYPQNTGYIYKQYWADLGNANMWVAQ